MKYTTILLLTVSIFLTGICIFSCKNQVADKTKELKANLFSVIDVNSDKIIYNGHEYQYDVVSGATMLPARNPDGSIPAALPLDEKEKLLYWSVQPPKGLIMGEYYTAEKPFGDPDSTYTAEIELVSDDGNVVHVEMDERAPENYYDSTWAGKMKRRSGYTFFQFSKPRTDITRVTWGNGMTFLEWQILKANSLNIDFDTVTGSSNSARDGFIPAVAILKDKVEEPSGKYYIGYSDPLANGTTPRLQLIFEGKKLINARYDEIFADTKEAITNQNQKKYYRQSKYDSIEYAKEDQNQFRNFADALTTEIVKNQKLDVTISNPLPEEMKNYREVAKKIQPAIDFYLKNGYTHMAQKLAEKPTKARNVRDAGIEQDNFKMSLKNYQYDSASETAQAEIIVENNGDVDYLLNSNGFHMVVYKRAEENAANYGPLEGHMVAGTQKKNVGERVSNSIKEDILVKAHSSVTVPLKAHPIYPQDTDKSIRFYSKKLSFTLSVDKK